jgi:FKBP12-rapamycin complex-associated protein
MAANNSHHVLHRMVPLICQGLTTFPGDTSTWLEGLRLLANPKLRTAMTMTTSIWLPLLIKGLEVSRPEEVILAALKLLGEVAEILEPMKSCFIKPLRALGRKEVFCEMAELSWACTRMGIVVWSNDRREIGRPNLMVGPLALLRGLPELTRLI